jgi:hypothetical protein
MAMLIDFCRLVLAAAPPFALAVACLSTGQEPRRALGRALVLWAGLALALSETAGAFHALGAAVATSFWLAVVIASLALVYRNRGNLRSTIALVPALWRSASGRWLLLVFGVLLAIAVTAAPNTWDSQTYHLARIEHWIQNAALAPYPTAIERQIGLNPLPEILELQFRLVAGSDAIANLVQWLGLAVCVAGAALIAEELGADRRGQALASLFVVTLPLAILQSTSTQTDLVTASFVVVFVARLLELLRQPRFGTGLECCLAISLGVLSKATAALIGLPFAVWLVCWLALPGRRGLKIGIFCAGATMFLAVNSLFFWRNYESFGALVSPEGRAVTNGSFGLAQTLNNAVYDIAVNLPIGIRPIDHALKAAIQSICVGLGLTAHSADTLFLNRPFSVPTGFSILHEDTASNPVHLAVAMVFGGGLVKDTLKGGGEQSDLIYPLCLAAGFLMFATGLRWQPWISRLETPLFVLAGPLVGVAAARWRPETIRRTMLILAAASLPWLLCNPTRPLLPYPYFFNSRVDTLFANRPALEQPYRRAAAAIIDGRFRNIGLVFGRDDWEYPLWFLLQPYLEQNGARIEHVVSDATSVTRYPNGPFHPDVLFATKGQDPEEVTVDGVVWTPFLTVDPVRLYRRAAP